MRESRTPHLATWARPTAPGRRRKRAPLGLTVSNPPTQAEVQAIADKLDELISTLSA